MSFSAPCTRFLYTTLHQFQGRLAPLGRRSSARARAPAVTASRHGACRRGSHAHITARSSAVARMALAQGLFQAARNGAYQFLLVQARGGLQKPAATSGIVIETMYFYLYHPHHTNETRPRTTTLRLLLLLARWSLVVGGTTAATRL